MAPGTRTPSQEKNDKPRFRKPAVEKLRRDRINTGIERLKVLLKDDLDPRCKLEKADVLEKAVVYLKNSKSLARASPDRFFTDGFTRCLEESACFLTMHMMSGQGHAMHPKASESISVNLHALKGIPECTGAVWRPW
ncbi:hairy-related 2 [Tachysurus ichikawai]